MIFTSPAFKNTYKQLKEYISSLPTSTIIEKIEQSYIIQLYEAIEAIRQKNLTDPQRQINSLCDFLKQNWSLVSGNLLCYTSRPQSPDTLFLCALATELANYINNHLIADQRPVSAAELLMPGVNLESSHKDYRDLGVCEHDGLNEQEEQELLKLEKLIVSRKIAAKTTDIIFTGEEDDPTSECCKKKQYIQLQQLKNLNVSAYTQRVQQLALSKELMQKISQFEQVQRYEHLSQRNKLFTEIKSQEHAGLVRIIGKFIVPLINLDEILKTHILSSAGGALIPVQLLLSEAEIPYRDQHEDELEAQQVADRATLQSLQREIDQEDKDNTHKGLSHYMHYLDLQQRFTQMAEHCQVSHQALVEGKNNAKQRIIAHSDQTTSLAEAKSTLARLRGDQRSLLGHLTELCNHLKCNGIEGVGSEENAGKGAYEAIRVFAEYYQTLDYQLKYLSSAQEHIYPLDIGLQIVLQEEWPGFSIRYKIFDSRGNEQIGTIKTEHLPNDWLTSLLDRHTRLISTKSVPLEPKNIFQEVFTINGELLAIIRQQIKLAEAEKDKIPQELKAEIELLLDLASNHQHNHNATANYATCVFTREQKLQPLIRTHEATLAQIQCPESTLANQLQQAESAVNQRATLLQQSLNNKSYSGRDTLPISRAILSALNVPLKIDNLATLNLLMKLNSTDIEEILFSKERKQEVINLFSSVESFDDFARSHSSSTLQALFKATSPHLLNKICQNSEDCFYLLFAQTEDKFTIYLRELVLYSRIFLIDDYLKACKEPEKKFTNRVLHNILSNRVNAILALTNRSHTGRHLPKAQEDLLSIYSQNRLFDIRALHHPEARQIAAEDFDKVPRLERAKQKDAELFGLTGTAASDIKAVIAAIKQSPTAMDYVSDHLKYEFNLHEILSIADHNLRQKVYDCCLNADNLDFIYEAVKNAPQLLGYLPNALRYNCNVLLAAWCTDKYAFYYADPSTKQSDDVKYFISHKPQEISNQEFRTVIYFCYLNANNIDYIVHKVQENWKLFIYLPECLRDNPRILYTAYQGNAKALNFASQRLQLDPQVNSIMTIYHREVMNTAWNYYLREDAEGVARCIARDKALFGLASDQADNRALVLEAMKKSGKALQYASPTLQQDEYLQYLATIEDNALRNQLCTYYSSTDTDYIKVINKTPNIFRHLPKKLRDDATLLLCAHYVGHYALDYASERLQHDPAVIRLTHHLRRTYFKPSFEDILKIYYCSLQADNIPLIIQYWLELLNSNSELIGFIDDEALLEGETLWHFCIDKGHYLAFENLVKYYSGNEQTLFSKLEMQNVNGISVMESALHDEKCLSIILAKLPQDTLLNPDFLMCVRSTSQIENKEDYWKRYYSPLLQKMLLKDEEENTQSTNLLSYFQTPIPARNYSRARAELNQGDMAEGFLSAETVDLLQKGSAKKVLAAWAFCLNYPSVIELINDQLQGNNKPRKMATK